MKSKDQELIAEAYESVASKRDIRLFMGNPEDIHYFDDLHERINAIRTAVHRGVKFITAYVKPGKDGYYYSLEPLPDISHGEYKEYQPALVPEEDIK